MFGPKLSRDELDAKIIERARSNLRHAARWGRWYGAFLLGIAIGFAVLLVCLLQMLIRMGNLFAQQMNVLEFWFGFVMGVFFGAVLFQMYTAVLKWSLFNFLNARDRLLVEYHDALFQDADDEKMTLTAGDRGAASDRARET